MFGARRELKRLWRGRKRRYLNIPIVKIYGDSYYYFCEFWGLPWLCKCLALTRGEWKRDEEREVYGQCQLTAGVAGEEVEEYKLSGVECLFQETRIARVKQRKKLPYRKEKAQRRTRVTSLPTVRKLEVMWWKGDKWSLGSLTSANKRPDYYCTISPTQIVFICRLETFSSLFFLFSLAWDSQ